MAVGSGVSEGSSTGRLPGAFITVGPSAYEREGGKTCVSGEEASEASEEKSLFSRRLLGTSLESGRRKTVDEKTKKES